MSIPVPHSIAAASAAMFDRLAHVFDAVDGEAAWLPDHALAELRRISLRQLQDATGQVVGGMASGLAAVSTLPMEERIDLLAPYYWAAAAFKTPRQDPEFAAQRQIGETFGEPWQKLVKRLPASTLDVRCHRCNELGTASITPIEHRVLFSCPACGQALDTRWRSALPLDGLPPSASIAAVAATARELILSLLNGLDEVIDLTVASVSDLGDLVDEAPPPDPLHLPTLSRIERAVLEGVRLGNQDAIALATTAINRLGGLKKGTSPDRLVDRLVRLGMLRRRCRPLPPAALRDNVASQMFHIHGSFETTKGCSTNAYPTIQQLQELIARILEAPASTCTLINRTNSLSIHVETEASPLHGEFLKQEKGDIISGTMHITRNRLTDLSVHADPEYEIIEEGIAVEGNRMLGRLFRADAEASQHIALQQRFPSAIIQANPRLSDVLGREAFTRLSKHFSEEDSRYLRHCYVDWAIYDADGYPAWVIELQRGPHHDNADWLRKDRLKRKLCLAAGLRFEEKF